MGKHKTSTWEPSVVANIELPLSLKLSMKISDVGYHNLSHVNSVSDNNNMQLNLKLKISTAISPPQTLSATKDKKGKREDDQSQPLQVPIMVLLV